MAEEKLFSKKKIAEDKSGDVIIIIANSVYNVSKFLDEHPGGHEVLVNLKGKDGTEDFDDIGHSLDAKELMKKYKVGELVPEERKTVAKKAVVFDSATEQDSSAGFFGSWKMPILFGVIATVLYSYLFG